jgi:hypothetical protein
MKFVRGALDALKVLAERARYGLVHSAVRVGVLWHADIDGFSREIARFVILECRCLRVNRLREPLCPEVPHLGASLELPGNGRPEINEIGPSVLSARSR